MTVGRLGLGIGLPPIPGRRAPPAIPKPLASGNCGLAGNDTNFSSSYQDANPGEVALRALIGSAKHSIFIDQQDLFSCLFLVEATYDDRLFELLANKVLDRIPITIVVSEGASKPSSPVQTYHNGLLRGIGSLAWALAPHGRMDDAEGPPSGHARGLPRGP